MEKELSTSAGATPAPVKWNRSEVSRFLVPVLKYCDLVRRDASHEEVAAAQQLAASAVAAAPRAYQQLMRVYKIGSDAALSQWFGGIDCDDELLEDAFIYIEEALNPPQPEPQPTPATAPDYRLESAFRSLCVISDEATTVNLLAPVEEYYFCDESRYEDYEYRRVLIADKCRAQLHKYLNHYLRVLDWYRTNFPAAADSATPSDDPALRPESHVYVKLLERWLAHADYERHLQEQISQLQYERGGLGWFHRKRKIEIDKALAALRVQQCRLRVEDANERCDAYCAPLIRQKEALQAELDCAPLTAFGRKKELRAKIAELMAKIDEYREQSGVDTLEAELAQLQKAARS